MGHLQLPGPRRLEFLYRSDDQGMDDLELQSVGLRLDIRKAHAAVRQLVWDTEAEIAAALDA